MITEENTITAPASVLAKLGKVKAEIAALQKVEKDLKKKIGLPSAKEIAEARKLKPTDKVTFTLVNGNGDECGKYSVSFRKEFVMPACWSGRLTV